jgi:hypothetical protein
MFYQKWGNFDLELGLVDFFSKGIIFFEKIIEIIKLKINILIFNKRKRSLYNKGSGNKKVSKIKQYISMKGFN